MAKTLNIKLVKSAITCPKNQKLTLKALGLTKKDQTVEHENSAVIMGMVNAIPHLLKVAE